MPQSGSRGVNGFSGSDVGPTQPASAAASRTPRQAGRNHRTPRRDAGILLAVGGGVHFLAILVSLVLVKVVIEARAGPVEWGAFFDSLSVTGKVMLLVGIPVQILFGLAGALAASLAFEGRGAVGTTTILTGLGGIVFSLLIFGGIVGMIGGVLVTTGGAVARTPRAPRSDTLK